MRNSIPKKTLVIVLAGIVLASNFSLVTAGLLLCIGDGTDPDCCRKTEIARQSSPGQSEQFLNGADCDCCVRVDAAPAHPGSSPYKVSLDAAAGPHTVKNVALPSRTRVARTDNGAASHERLSSLRTVVLLV